MCLKCARARNAHSGKTVRAMSSLKFAARAGTTDRSFETSYESAPRSDACFDTLVQFPQRCVSVERVPKDHRSDGDTMPQNPLGRPLDKFIVDALEHFKSPTVTVTNVAQNFVPGPAFDAQTELVDYDIEYTDDGEPTTGSSRG
jgi:hypothetical protein